jgi:hypothetical protein
MQQSSPQQSPPTTRGVCREHLSTRAQLVSAPFQRSEVPPHEQLTQRSVQKLEWFGQSVLQKL